MPGARSRHHLRPSVGRATFVGWPALGEAVAAATLVSSETIRWCAWCGEETADLWTRRLYEPGTNREPSWGMSMCLPCCKAWDALDMASVLARHDCASGTTTVERTVRPMTP